jgi:flagellar biosynthesis protein FlhA
VAAEIGMILPKVRVRDSFQNEQHEYRLKIAGMTVASGSVHTNKLLAVESTATTGQVPGADACDPVSGAAALWISRATRSQAERNGYTVIEPGEVIANHLTETVRRHADEILTRDATKHLVDELRQTAPAAVDELIPARMTLSEVQQILQILLREQVPIRQLAAILETLGDYAPRTKDPILLSEYVRARLSRSLCTKYRDAGNRLFVATLDPELEDQIRAGYEHGESGVFIRMAPAAVQNVCRLVAEQIERLAADRHPPVLLVSPPIRAAVKELTSTRLPELVVLSYNEITRDTKIESVSLIAGVT